MALVSKKKNSASVPKQQIIRINPYEVHGNVLHLMSQISSARPSATSDLFWEPIFDVIFSEENSLYSYIDDNRSNLSNIDFMEGLKSKLDDLSIELQTRENTNHTQIVVAGGFSSGKSSFLNKLVGDGNLLPTGVDPVSVVPTYLYCSEQHTEAKVKGVNTKNAVISLPKEVLQAIQHSNKSNIHIASVLEKLFVEVNAPRIKGIVFIDTPGYNNSTKKNDSNGKTDEETARASLKEGQALIWLVDCEKGVTVTEDLNIIKEFKGPKLIVFHKADKKGELESKNIVESTGADLEEKFGDDLIDVIAYSSLEEKLYASYYEYESLDEIFEDLKEDLGGGNSGRKKIISDIENMFDDEITTSIALSKELEAERKDAIQEKKNASVNQTETEGIYSNWKGTITEVAQSYVDVDKARTTFQSLSSDAIDEFLSFYNGVMKFENEDHWGSSNILTNAIKRADSAYDRLVKRYNNEINRDYVVYKQEYIKGDFAKTLVSDADILKEQQGKALVEEAEARCEQIRESIKTEQDLVSSLESYKSKLIAAINKGIKAYEQGNKMEQVKKKESSDTFTAVKQGDLASLVFAMSIDASNDDAKRDKNEKQNGYDLSKCNSEGYTLLTYAVECGQIEIVKFMLDHEADPSSFDRRGYNSFLTAVEQQNKTMCELILSYDPDLIDSTTKSGENAEDLMNKKTFSKWLANKL